MLGHGAGQHIRPKTMPQAVEIRGQFHACNMACLHQNPIKLPGRQSNKLTFIIEKAQFVPACLIRAVAQQGLDLRHEFGEQGNASKCRPRYVWFSA